MPGRCGWSRRGSIYYCARGSFQAAAPRRAAAGQDTSSHTEMSLQIGGTGEQTVPDAGAAPPSPAAETAPPAPATPVPTLEPVVPTMEVEEETEIITDEEEIGVGSIGF